MTKAQAKKIKELLPLINAIKNRCLDCSAGSNYEIKMCVCPSCALFPYRLGLNSETSKTTHKKQGSAVKTTSGDGSGEAKNE